MQKTSQYSRQADFEVLKRELIVWKNAYLPIVWLQQRQQELTFGTQPLDYLRQNNHRSYQNGDVRTTTSRSDSNRYETDTMSKVGHVFSCHLTSNWIVVSLQSKSIGDDESDASTFLPDRYGQRAFSLNRSSKNNSVHSNSFDSCWCFEIHWYISDECPSCQGSTKEETRFRYTLVDWINSYSWRWREDVPGDESFLCAISLLRPKERIPIIRWWIQDIEAKSVECQFSID